MDMPSLENAIRSLESAFDALESWLTFWTAVVVMGLIVEYAWDVEDLLKQKTFNWRLLGALLGGVLITAGVTGELFVQVRASKVEAELRRESHTEVALLNGEVGKANARASVAEEATETERLARAKVEEKVARLNREIADADERAESERLARIKIQQELAPRILNRQQRERITERLRSFAGTQYDLRVDPIPETINFLVAIDRALRAAGWTDLPPQWRTDVLINLNLQNGERAGEVFSTGVTIELTQGANPKLGGPAKALTLALRAEGINAVEGVGNIPNPAAIHVVVGSKE